VNTDAYQDGYYTQQENRPSSSGRCAVCGLTNAIKTKDGDGPAEIEPLSMHEIIESLQAQTGDWPRRVGDLLFVHDRDHGINYLLKQEALFGWIHRETGSVEWSQATGCVTKGEFYNELKRTARNYGAVETLPHFPPLDDHYYAHSIFEPGNGEAFRSLLARFNPATTIDADLILALFVTPFWGGPGGMRPAFVATADEGRGSGKTALLRAVGHLVGGAFEIGVADPIEAIKKRLLTPSALTKRLVSADNIKSNKYSNGDLQGLITQAEISGHQMYVGEATRPNTLTWAFTLNGPSFSRDLAQRCVIIKLAKPTYSATWAEETTSYIDANRAALISDIAAFYQQPPYALERCSRWGHGRRMCWPGCRNRARHRSSLPNGRRRSTATPRKWLSWKTTSSSSCGGTRTARMTPCLFRTRSPHAGCPKR
jgi:hypothetical protein